MTKQATAQKLEGNKKPQVNRNTELEAKMKKELLAKKAKKDAENAKKTGQAKTTPAGEVKILPTKQAETEKAVKDWTEIDTSTAQSKAVQAIEQPAEQPAEKIKEKYSDASLILLNKETGERIETLSAEMIKDRFIKVKGICRNEFYIKNYTDDDNDTLNHNFSKIFGLKFSTWEVEQIKRAAKKEMNGQILTFSADSGNNHFILIIPNKPIIMRGIDGGEIMLTPENYLSHYICITRHGRLYNWARILSYQYGLTYCDLPNGKYILSNATNWNFTIDTAGNFRLYGLDGRTRQAENPFNYITGKADINKVIKPQ
jgi:hypothetical protein